MTLTIKNNILFLLLGTILFFVTPFFANGQAIDPTVEQELYGWAWSDTIGWISMNCENTPDGCVSEDYRVTRIPENPVRGRLEGFAWSEHIGWIEFGGDISGRPPDLGGRAVMFYNPGQEEFTMSGWVRALAGLDFDNDGWDGLILLSNYDGSEEEFGIRFSAEGSNAGEALDDSYAWGGEVVGWVDFSGVTLGVPVADPDPTGDISGEDCVIAVGASTCQTEIDWTIENADTPNVTGPSGTVSTNENGPQTVTLQRGNNTFQALDGSDILDSVTLNAQCVVGAIWDASEGICVAILPNLEPINYQRTSGGFNEDGIANQNFRFRIRNIGATSTDAIGVNEEPGTVYHSLRIDDVSDDLNFYEDGPRINTDYYGSTSDLDFESEPILPDNDSLITSYNGIPLMFGHYVIFMTADPTSASRPEGRIQEEDEDNNVLRREITINPPNFTPILTVTPRIIRSGQDADLIWTGIPPWVNCVVTGAGLPGGSMTIPFDGDNRPNGRVELENRTSSSRYQMVCTEPSTGTTFESDEARLEVLPRLEEI